MGRVWTTCLTLSWVVRGTIGCGVRFAGTMGAYLLIFACSSYVTVALAFIAAYRFAEVFLDLIT